VYKPKESGTVSSARLRRPLFSNRWSIAFQHHEGFLCRCAACAFFGRCFSILCRTNPFTRGEPKSGISVASVKHPYFIFTALRICHSRGPLALSVRRFTFPSETFQILVHSNAAAAAAETFTSWMRKPAHFSKSTASQSSSIAASPLPQTRKKDEHSTCSASSKL